MNRYLRLLPYALREWRILLGILGLSALGSAMTALQPWPLKLLVDYGLAAYHRPNQAAQLPSGPWAHVPPQTMVLAAALASLVLFFGTAISSAVITWGWSIAGQRMVRRLATDLFAHLQRLSLQAYMRRPTADFLNRLTLDTWCLYKMTDGVLITPAAKLFTLLMVGSLAWRLNPELAMIALGTAPIIGAVSHFIGQRMRKRARRLREVESQLSTLVHQSLSAIATVQSFGLESRNRSRFAQLSQQAIALAERGALLVSAYGLTAGVITTSGLALVLYIGGKQSLAGSLSLGSFLVFLAYMRTLQTSAESAFALYGTLKPLEASMDRILEVFDAAPEGVPRSAHPLKLPPLRKSKGRGIGFQHVTFGYDRAHPVLKDLSLEVKAGETIALVGPSGAGKSTLISLIPRFYDPCEGQVLFEGQDLRLLNLTQLRSEIAIVPQDAHLLRTTVAENIAYGRLGAHRDEILAAAQAAKADLFINRLPQGYDTVLGEKGATLSGGERQRLALARAFLKNAPVLILDEPTSALDVETEELILKALERLVEGRTTLIIAHRLSTLRVATRIAVVQEGRIEATGGQAHLMQTCELFRRQYALHLAAANPIAVE